MMTTIDVQQIVETYAERLALVEAGDFPAELREEIARELEGWQAALSADL